jgi:hypothetical protein
MAKPSKTRKQQRSSKPNRQRYSVGEYFLAGVGVVMIAGVIAIVATSRSCSVGPAPDLGIQPAAPRPTPTRPAG